MLNTFREEWRFVSTFMSNGYEWVFLINGVDWLYSDVSSPRILYKETAILRTSLFQLFLLNFLILPDL